MSKEGSTQREGGGEVYLERVCQRRGPYEGAPGNSINGYTLGVVCTESGVPRRVHGALCNKGS